MCCKGLAQLEGSWLAQRKGSFQLALDASEVPWCLWHFSFVIITFSHFLTLLLHSGSVLTFDISVFIVISGKGVRVQNCVWFVSSSCSMGWDVEGEPGTACSRLITARPLPRQGSEIWCRK